MTTALNQKFANNAKKFLNYGPSTFRKWFYGFEKKYIPWCAIFVSYVANVTGVLGTLIPKSAGAGSIARSGINIGCGKWYEGHNTKPQVGDIILFTWNGKGRYPNQDKYFSDHVGIVYKVDTKYVYTIEGNTNSNNNDTSKVGEHKYKLYSGLINGYFRPDWSMKTEQPPGKYPDAIYCVRAGDKKVIDAIQIVYNGKLKAHYRVSPVKRNYYDFQDDDETTKGQDGYAGSFGTSIDRLQIKIEQ